MKDENRSKSGLDMSNILEDPELDKKAHEQEMKRELSNEAVREWTNESKQTE